VLFRGYIDESYNAKDQKLFALSCLIATGKDWFAFERSWKLHLDAVNNKLKREGRPRICRYHASDCSGRRKEFKGWTHEERDVFVLGLFGIFKRIPVHVVAFDVNLDELCEVFPEWAGDRLKTAYSILTRFVMHTIGEDFDKLSEGKARLHGDKITLFHDRTGSDGKYDPVILQAFNSEMADRDFPHKNYFTSITSLGWEDCIALQPADLIAFEMFKEAEAKIGARTRRRSFDALYNMEAFGIHKRSFRKEAMQNLRTYIEEREGGPSVDALVNSP
jgi:hypothetical protein